MSNRKPGDSLPENPLFFPTPDEFRAWLLEHHDTVDVQWVGFYKKATAIPSITWPQSVDEALCFGWIDGLRKSLDHERYMIRFTPRRSGSHWSAKNLKRMPELDAAGRVHERGRAAHASRDRKKERLASYEQKDVTLPEEYEHRIRKNGPAWRYFEACSPSYRKQVTWWIISAKKSETRLRRLEVLIESCETGTVVPPHAMER